MLRRLAPSLALALAIAPAAARADDTKPPAPTDAGSRITPMWAAFQLIPSPEVVIWDGIVRFGVRWQVTPLLYSFGINRKLSPWRGMVLEPSVRHTGSIELYIAPEYVAGDVARYPDHWIFRGGLRGYFPILERGEQLSGSIGASLFTAKDKAGAGMDVGVSTFGGFFGLRVGYSPTPGLRMTTITFEVRFL